MQIVITRDNGAVPWGFRLKGGAEYNVPLSILKVNEGSPSHRKLEVGDIIANIGSYPALNLSHEDALNIIRQFDLNLPLVIQREQNQFSSGYAPKITAKASTVWRPPSVSSFEINPNNQNNNSSYYQPAVSNNLISTVPNSARPGSSPYHNDLNQQQRSNQYQSQSIYQPAVVSSQQPMHSPSSTSYNQYAPNSPHMQSPSYIKPFQSSPQQQTFQPTSQTNYYNGGSVGGGSYESLPYNQPLTVQPIQAAPPPPPPAYIPPPPPPMDSSYTQPAQKSWNTSYDLKPVSASNMNKSINSDHNNNSGSVPDALLKSMTGSGKKPFTYTPGGLDLSHVKNSLRVKRHEQQTSSSTNNQYHQQQHQQQQHHLNQQQSYSNYSNQQTYNTTHQSNYSSPSYISNSSTPYMGPISNFGGGSDDEMQYATPVSPSTHFRPPVSNPPQAPPAPIPASVPAHVPAHVPAPAHAPSYQSHAPAPIRLNSTSSAAPYKPINFDSVPSTPKMTRPITYQPSKSQAPSVIYQGSALNLTPDQLVKLKKEENKEHNMMNQSFSFRMLNKWIEDSESKIIPMKSKKDEEEEREKEKNVVIKKSEVIKALEEEENKSQNFHQQQQQSQMRQAQSSSQLKSVSINPAHAVPSKVFQYVNRKYSVTEDETTTTSQQQSGNVILSRKQSFSEEQYQRAPARERIQEQAPPKYKGAHIPSKAFSYLQYLTQNESVVTNTTNNASSFSNPLLPPTTQINEPANLQYASVQVFESNASSEKTSENKKKTFKITSNSNNNATFLSINNESNLKNIENNEVNEINLEKKELIVQDLKIEDNNSNQEFLENVATTSKAISQLDAPLTEISFPVNTESNTSQDADASPTTISLDDNSKKTLSASASFIEISPASESNPCLNEPAVTFSNEETINATINLNDSKETNEIETVTSTEITTAEEKILPLKNNDLNTETENGNPSVTNAQEIVIETSEF